MYRAALRSTPRIVNPLRQTHLATAGRRFASNTSPDNKGRSWKGSALRWGLAIGAVYWYSTSAVFAEEPQLQTIQPPPQFSDDDLPTVEAVIAQKRKEAEARLQKAATPESKTVPKPETEALATEVSSTAPANEVETTAPAPEEGSPEALEEEAAQQGAFNPETGEINWDCPCLGGMAHGPCGEEFKAAFSCFVYSTEEPKGMDCIDKFQHMQDCFRLHPDVYGDELADDENENAAGDSATEVASVKDAPEGSANAAASSPAPSPAKMPTESTPEASQIESTEKKEAVSSSTTRFIIPATSPLLIWFSSRPTGRVIAKMSYADVAASGPKQTPEEAAAPRPPQVITSESASTSSLIDVDTPSVRTVPSDFLEQDIQTETQAIRREMEDAAARARAEAEFAKKKSATKARKADGFLTRYFGSLSDEASSALVLTNLAAIVGVSAYLGYKALGLYERGRLTWKNIGIGAGVALGVGLFEAALGNYLYKGKKSEKS